MYTVKGPYGYFLYEDPETDKTIWDYAVKAINKSFSDYLLPVYINKASGEISYDCSNLISIDNYCQNHTAGKTPSSESRRKHLKDLFIFLFNCPDYLLSPSNIVWDTEYIYTDISGNIIKLCMRPFYEDMNSLTISLTDTNKAEKVLSHAFFREVLTDEEKDRIIYLIKSNGILNPEDIFIEENTPKTKQRFKINEDIFFGFASAVISLLLMISGSIVPSALFFTLGLITQIALLTKTISRKRTAKTKNKKEISQNRKEVLFGNSQSDTNQGFCYLTLTSKQSVDGNYIQRTIYSKSAVLGSDQFLSDIPINDKSVLPVQAEISQNNNLFYLKDKSDNHSTYLESRQLTPDTNYEIKSGQTITLGDIELEITIGKT